MEYIEEMNDLRINHKWSHQDVLVSYLIYRLRITPNNKRFKKIAKILGIRELSLSSALLNFEYLDGIGNYNRYSKLAKEVFEGFINVPVRLLVPLVQDDDIKIMLEEKLSSR
jgi:hypothetical protein